MKDSRALTLISRLLLGLMSVAASIYCLIAYIPFTYQQVIRGNLLPALTTAVRFHPLLYWVVFCLLALSLYPAARKNHVKSLVLAFLGTHFLLGLGLVIHPVLTNLRNDRSSLVWSCVFLLPLLWIAVIDWRMCFGSMTWANSDCDDSRLFQACFCSAVFLAVLYAGVAYGRLFVTHATYRVPTAIFIFTSNVTSHLLIFMGLFLVLSLLIGIANSFSLSSRIEFVLCSLVLATIVAITIRHMVLSGLSLNGSAADFYSLLFGLSAAAFLSGISLRLSSAGAGSIRSGLGALIVPFAPHGISSRLIRFLCALALSAVGTVTAMKAATFDWNYLLQEMSVVVIWAMGFALFYAMSREGDPRTNKTLLLVGAAIAVLASYKYVQASAVKMKVVPESGAIESMPSLLDRYAGQDISFRLARTILSPAPSDTSFYHFLAESTNIARDTEVKAVDVALVDKLVSSRSDNPNIFIIVIDSLRRDYVSPYNSAVTFTPAIDRFARESAVFQNAFARYGGTGLSEPSIWAGGMLLHKQYVMPFAPMNTLEKLVEADHYQAFISRDSILSAILSPALPVVELDHQYQTMDYDLTRTLRELEAKIDQREPAAGPMFVYTQPQNLHISVINRQHASVVDNEAYPGFYAPYASRLRQIDNSFGEFVDFLKKRGLYDNSILILTADHGDSLGEDGRWGHAYTIYPEVLRVPLIVHLPTPLRGLAVDEKAPAFLTDITPTLYYLLGHQPVRASDITGRPLFTSSLAEQAAYRQNSYLVASSYGAVYGVLNSEGSQLFIADGVNYHDYLYELTPTGSGSPINLSFSEQVNYRKFIRSGISEIDSLYGFRPGGASYERVAKN